ncbi:MAG TPA: DUF4145 domain-containing protein [Fimbriimonas sp.]|nr:DUF4145 domain-containing protein [Fimbriimonas sp.]
MGESAYVAVDDGSGRIVWECVQMPIYNWGHAGHSLPAFDYACGYCGREVSSDFGYMAGHQGNHNDKRYIYICPRCEKPTLRSSIGPNVYSPRPLPGESVQRVPDPINTVYEEARRAYQAESYNGTVLLCRKIIVHLGHELGAGKKTFNETITWLDTERYIPKGGKRWVDHIREKGNETTHEITPMSPGEAQEVLDFTLMLLKNIYDYPGRILATNP